MFDRMNLSGQTVLCCYECVCDSTLLMSGSDLLEHIVCSSLIKSVSSSENTDRPTGSLQTQWHYIHFQILALLQGHDM